MDEAFPGITSFADGNLVSGMVKYLLSLSLLVQLNNANFLKRQIYLGGT